MSIEGLSGDLPVLPLPEIFEGVFLIFLGSRLIVSVSPVALLLTAVFVRDGHVAVCSALFATCPTTGAGGEVSNEGLRIE